MPMLQESGLKMKIYIRKKTGKLLKGKAGLVKPCPESI
jgi:hypothetical protein